MSKDNFFKRIKGLLAGDKRTSQSNEELPPEASTVGKLLRMVENTDEVEIGCDDVFELLDEYVELEGRGEDAAKLMPLVKRHLDNCRDCHEEYEALVRVLKASSDISE